MKFSNLAEHQIQKARAEGQFDNLKGAGKSLPRRHGEGAESIGFRAMAEAGVLPREIELKKAVDEQREVIQSALGTDREKAEMGKLADLQLRLSIEQEARRRFFSD